MNINWYGKSFFQITTQKAKKSNIELLIEPFIKDDNIKVPKIKADIVIQKNESDPQEVGGDYFSILNPGEYEIGGVFIQKLDYKKGQALCLIEAENIRVCYLKELKGEDITSDDLSLVSGVDILIISSESIKLVPQIEPKIVIPMNGCFSGKDSKKESEDSLNRFLKIMGASSVEAIPKLSIKSRDFSSRNGIEVVALTPKN